MRIVGLEPVLGSGCICFCFIGFGQRCIGRNLGFSIDSVDNHGALPIETALATWIVIIIDA
jgi:hypothetical protein